MPLTPMMQKYMETKEEYKDCILFYRLGDFYEMFFEDAKTCSQELDLTLTGKSCGLEAVSYTHLDVYKRQMLILLLLTQWKNFSKKKVWLSRI